MYACFLILLIVGAQLCSSCDTLNKRHRCRIQNKRCSCDDYGCNSEYRYETLQECEKALRGKKNDNCNPNPCMHNGSCLQISQQPGYRCRCEGTGYFGQRCHRACPKLGARLNDLFPYECIVI